MGEEKEYDLLVEGNQMVAALCQKYPKILWAVNPEHVIVLGITNKERPKKMKKLATIHRISAAMKTIIRALGRKEVKYYVEVYCSDYSRWSNPRRQWVLFHELVHIPSPVDNGGLLQHDCQDWNGLIDFCGIDWWNKESLPDMLAGEALPLREELFTRLHIKDEGEDEGSAGGENNA
jgi:predicted metallopeptidase